MLCFRCCRCLRSPSWKFLWNFVQNRFIWNLFYQIELWLQKPQSQIACQLSTFPTGFKEFSAFSDKWQKAKPCSSNWNKGEMTRIKFTLEQTYTKCRSNFCSLVVRKLAFYWIYASCQKILFRNVFDSDKSLFMNLSTYGIPSERIIL